MDRFRIQRSYPHVPWLSANDPDAIRDYLTHRQLLGHDEPVRSIAPAGEGNMNLTLRVVTPSRSLIIKQARPWVEKYDHIAAPWGRMHVEQGFYEQIESIPGVVGRMPKRLHSDPDGYIIVLEDIGVGVDLTNLYKGAKLEDGLVVELAAYLSSLHDGTRLQVDGAFANREMRALNHEHIYCLPLRENNGLDLEAIEPGLSASARQLSGDRSLVEAVEETGAQFLNDGDCLLHGDFFPGSWLRQVHRLMVIDPEFCFCGDAEFDLGCAIAHLAMARQPIETARMLFQYYEASVGTKPMWPWISRYAACEVVRRLIGVAQLPLSLPAGGRAALLHRARHTLLEADWEALWE